MTMQTFMVFLIGATYGVRLSLLTLVAYLFEGAIGLPVFAAGGGIVCTKHSLMRDDISRVYYCQNVNMQSTGSNKVSRVHNLSPCGKCCRQYPMITLRLPHKCFLLIWVVNYLL